jgi:tetratricopeptide (TPR) repeat protein
MTGLPHLGVRMGALSLMLLAACGSSPPAPSRIQQQAVEANQRAARAFQDRRFDEARSFYAEALRLDLSVENNDGAAANLLSLARVEQAAGRPGSAHAYLDRLLSGVPVAFAVPHQAQAAARKAQLDLDAAQLSQAADWAARAESLCRQSGCTTLAAILNLRARAALASGDARSALEILQRAPGAADAAGGRAERANGLRLAAEARLLLKDPEAAVQALAQALDLDQSLGLPERIYRDLMLLGQAAGQMGRRDEARSYYQRALTVSAASGDAGAQRQAREQLDRM